MVTKKQTLASRKNIKKAQAAWQKMTSTQRARAQPEGRKRKRPGTTSQGNWYRIEVRPKGEFVTFRNHDVGKKNGNLERVAGQRRSGSWATQAWLVNKKSAHKEGKRLVADTKEVRALLGKLGSAPQHIKGDIFAAKDRPNVPEKVKPTKAQQTARVKNIKKAQSARAAKQRRVKKQS